MTASFSRRQCVQGVTALAFGGGFGKSLLTGVGAADAAVGGADDAALRQALDLISGKSAPTRAAEKLKVLAEFSRRRLSPVSSIDLHTVRTGLTIDARLEERQRAGDVRAVYALRLARNLGAVFEPERAHRWLGAATHRLTTRAEALLRAQGLHQGTVGERFLALSRDSADLYSDDGAGRDQAVADMNRCLDLARSRLPLAFDDIPAWCLRVAVDRLSTAEEAAGKQGYRRLPTPSAPGAYVADLRDIRRRPRWTLPSVVHHELLPGHLLQLPIEAAANPHPLRLEYSKAFSEGWGTYAEDLMVEQGVFRDDARAELGQLHWLLFRSLRGLADTGLHHAGWSQLQALQTLRSTQGLPAYFADFDDDVERIAAEPGLRAAEALVWLQLRDLRRATSDVRVFHRRALQYGRRPLTDLRSGI